jgi:hypothetical protein
MAAGRRSRRISGRSSRAGLAATLRTRSRRSWPSPRNGRLVGRRAACPASPRGTGDGRQSMRRERTAPRPPDAAGSLSPRGWRARRGAAPRRDFGAGCERSSRRGEPAERGPRVRSRRVRSAAGGDESRQPGVRPADVGPALRGRRRRPREPGEPRHGRRAHGVRGAGVPGGTRHPGRDRQSPERENRPRESRAAPASPGPGVGIRAGILRDAGAPPESRQSEVRGDPRLRPRRADDFHGKGRRGAGGVPPRPAVSFRRSATRSRRIAFDGRSGRRAS